MKRKFIIDLLFLIIINLLVKPFYIFGIDRTVQNVVGPESYGLFFAVFNFTYIFQIILDFGLQYYNNRSIAQHEPLIQKFLPNILAAKSVLAILYLMVAFAIAYAIGYSSFQMHLLLFLALNQIIMSLIMYLRSNISGMHFFKADSLISIADKLMMIIIVGTMLWLTPISSGFTISHFVYAQTASYLLTLIFCLIILSSHLRTISFQLNRPMLLLIMKKSYPYAIAVFLMAIYNRVDGVMIEYILGDAGALEAGIYAAAYRILDAVNMFGFLFASLLMPMFARMLQKKESMKELVLTSFKSIFIIGLVIAINSYFFRNEIMTLLYTRATPYYGEIYGLLIFSFLAVGSMYIFGSLLTANGSLKQMNILFIFTVILNIGMNYYLIPEYGAYGAAVATVVTQSLVVIGQMILVYLIFKIAVTYRLVLKLLLFIGILLAMNILLPMTGFSWEWNFLIAVAISVLLSPFFGLFELRQIISLK